MPPRATLHSDLVVVVVVVVVAAAAAAAAAAAQLPLSFLHILSTAIETAIHIGFPSVSNRRSPINFRMRINLENVLIAIGLGPISDIVPNNLMGDLKEEKSGGRKNPPSRPLGMVIKVKPHAKKAKKDHGSVEEGSDIVKTADIDKGKSSDGVKTSNCDTDKSHDVLKIGLVSYSDESEDDE